MATFSDADIRYVLAGYRTLHDLCDGRAATVAQVRELIAAGVLPRPTYVLPSGEARFPPDYFALVDEAAADAGGVAALPALFRSRYLAAASPQSGSADEDADEDWAGYLSGEFGVCLWSVTPESMAAKNRLVRGIERLTAGPDEAGVAWRTELRTAVDDLDALLRPFTDFDRERWGDTGRARYVERVRERFPAVFGGAAEGRGPMAEATS
jgi:hypothetical protein